VCKSCTAIHFSQGRGEQQQICSYGQASSAVHLEINSEKNLGKLLKLSKKLPTFCDMGYSDV